MTRTRIDISRAHPRLTVAEAVRLIFRKGYYLELERGGRIVVTYWGASIPQEDLNALEPHYHEFKRRLKPPRGWPKDIPLPPWWSDVALGFRIIRAERRNCFQCGYPVGVLVDFADYAEWHCPQCGTTLESAGKGG